MYQSIIDHPWLSGTIGAMIIWIGVPLFTGFIPGGLIALIYWMAVASFAWSTKDKRTNLKQTDDSWKDNLVH